MYMYMGMCVDNLRVLTFSFCFRGVFTPFACDRKNERIAAIGDKLTEGEFDIVLLQEVSLK